MRVVSLGLSLIVATACSSAPSAPPAGQPSPTPTASIAQPSPEPAGVPSVDLAGRVPTTDLREGWSVESCDPGDAPLLCLFRGGDRVGTIEWSQRPLDLEPGLAEDLDRMPPADALAANLERAGFFESTEADRRDNCEGRSVEWQRPAAATVANAEGMSFAFTVPDETGTPQDVVVSYQVVNAERALFILVVEGLGPRTCIPSEGEVLAPQELAAFRPVLDAFVANLRLPAPEV